MEWNGMEWNGIESNRIDPIKCAVVAGADVAVVEGISAVFLYDVNIELYNNHSQNMKIPMM